VTALRICYLLMGLLLGLYDADAYWGVHTLHGPLLGAAGCFPRAETEQRAAQWQMHAWWRIVVIGATGWRSSQEVLRC
jgi:hypothetical protein